MGGVVSQFLIFSDKGGRGGKPIYDFWLTRAGGGLNIKAEYKGVGNVVYTFRITYKLVMNTYCPVFQHDIHIMSNTCIIQ